MKLKHVKIMREPVSCLSVMMIGSIIYFTVAVQVDLL